MKKIRIDWLVSVYSLLTLAALVVSAPATYRIVAAYHSDGTPLGIASAVAMLVILEVGAVMAKLATLWTPRNHAYLIGFTIGALVINTLSNWIHGGLTASANGIAWVAAWGGALLYAAMLPGLIYLFLHLTCDRVAEMRGIQRTTADEVARILQPVDHAVEVARQAQQRLAMLAPAPMLPEPQAIYARAQAATNPEAAQPVLMPQIECHVCGHKASEMQLRTAKQHSGWRCSCGVKVPLAASERAG